jgi:hypothetical protein
MRRRHILTEPSLPAARHTHTPRSDRSFAVPGITLTCIPGGLSESHLGGPCVQQSAQEPQVDPTPVPPTPRAQQDPGSPSPGGHMTMKANTSVTCVPVHMAVGAVVVTAECS